MWLVEFRPELVKAAKNQNIKILMKANWSTIQELNFICFCCEINLKIDFKTVLNAVETITLEMLISEILIGTFWKTIDVK